MKFEKVWLFHIATVVMIVLICYYLFTTMVYTIETTPDIKDIGGPPAITDLKILALLIIGLVVPIAIILKLGPKDDKNQP